MSDSKNNVIRMIAFLYNQDNLELMAADRELITKEPHSVNDFYGQAHILRKYCNYPRPIKVVYEHSLPIHNIIWNVDSNNIMPFAFVSSQHRLNVYKKSNIRKPVFNVGSIMNYAISIVNPAFAKSGFVSNDERSGSIYFPSHSTHHIESTNDSDKIIESLLKLPDVYKPIYVCMYWKDIQYGKHINYIRNGIKVVSAGHIYDNQFYFRLYDILKNFKYTLGSSFGSFIFHAARAGSLVVFPKELENLKDNYSINTENFNDKDFLDRVKFAESFDKIVSATFKERIEHYSNAQLSFIENYSDSKLLSPIKIKFLLMLAEPLYFINLSILKVKGIAKRILKYLGIRK